MFKSRRVVPGKHLSNGVQFSTVASACLQNQSLVRYQLVISKQYLLNMVNGCVQWYSV